MTPRREERPGVPPEILAQLLKDQPGLAPETVARVLKMHLSSIYRMIWRGALQATKIRGRYFIPPEEVARIQHEYRGGNVRVRDVDRLRRRGK